MRTLIVYATTDGHTRQIANRIAKTVEDKGHVADIVDCARPPRALAVSTYDAYILAGSIHMSKHQGSLVRFVKTHLVELRSKPSAFLSVSLSAVIEDDKHKGEVATIVNAFFSETGLWPTVWTPVAGALLYTKYDWLKRRIMQDISKKEGRDTDTSRDYVYTDWDALARFVEAFVVKCVSPEAALATH